MTREGVLRDLKALSRGRGLRRPNVRSWVGPDLLALMGASPRHTDAELRSVLAQLLTRHSQPLPQDQRYLFRVAVGLGADLPMLEGRLAVASQKLDRSVRVLRRRLREAEVLVADSLLHQRGEAVHWWEAQGWQWLGLGARLVLREDAVLTLDQEVLALTAQPKFIHEMFTIPGLTAGEEPLFEAISGIQIVQVERTGATGWRVSMELPQDLAGGDSVGTTLRIRVPRASALQPYLVLAPVRDYASAVVEVDFGAASAASSYWVLDGVLPSDLGPARTIVVPPTAKPAMGRVSCAFERPRVGLAYGVAWRPYN